MAFKFSPKKRSGARKKAMQALYQWQMTRQTPLEIETEFLATENMQQVDTEYFHQLLYGISACSDDLDARLQNALDRPAAQLDPIEHAVLWLGLYELQYLPEVPWRVVINEAVELTKQFGAEQSHKYINGVLDKLARELNAAASPAGSAQVLNEE